MGSNKNKNVAPGTFDYGPNPGQSGSDPRGRLQNQSIWQQKRFEDQQGPLAESTAANYNRGTELGFQDYGNIMNQFSGVASGLNDPFKSYGGMQDFATTGGYSPQDIANMRARGVSPIRAAYANAEREMGRQRSLQGGYAPNMIAAQAKMAREQGQLASDATQNVEAGLAEARNKGRQFGLTGMGNIEGQRAENQLKALGGMGSLYGATPGMASTFGNQALGVLNAGGTFGTNLLGRENESQTVPGRFDTIMNRVGQGINLVNQGAKAAAPFVKKKKSILPSTNRSQQVGYTDPQVTQQSPD